MVKSRIVAFAKDWNDVPTCITHVMREHAKQHPVLWINSIGLRVPSAHHSGDLGRIASRFRSMFKPAEPVENQLRVKSLCLIPKATSILARWLNRLFFRLQVKRDLCAMGEGPVEYWCAVPNAVDLLPASRQRPAETATCNTHQSEPSSLHPASGPKVIYYCVDDWGKFENLDGPWLEKKEARLIERADVIFTPAEHLEKKCAGIEAENRPGQTAGKIHRMPHGVEYRKFAKAISKDLSIPIDVAGLSKPVVGFYGNLYPWIDFDLLDDLVSRCSDYTFIVIGQAYCDISRFSKYGNIHLLGRREHDQLPAYCKAFDAAIVPYDIKNPRMESVNPVKIKELLAAGVPIVASDIPEVRSIEGVIPAKGIDEWMAALELQISRTDRYELSHSVRQEDWSVKVAQMRGIVEKTGKSGVNYEML